jgi:hypothetical protein
VIALGWTVPDHEVAPPFETAAALSCAAVWTTGDRAASPLDRLRLQVLCARTLPSFLPLAAHHPARLEDALDMARRDGRRIAARLSALSGLVQLVARAEWAAPAPRSTDARGGRAWLRDRAARSAADAAGRAAVSEAFRAAFEPWARAPVVLSSARGGIQAAALVDARAADPAMAAVADELAARSSRSAGRLSVTGPWPAYSFCELVP